MGAKLAGFKNNPADVPALGVVAKPAVQSIHVGGSDTLTNEIAVSIDGTDMC